MSHHPSFAIPRNIWCYWHDGSPPYLQRACLDQIRRLHPAWNIHLLTAVDLPSPKERPDIHRLNCRHQADWIRLDRLRNHGGVWLDLGMILFRPLDAGWLDPPFGSGVELRAWSLSAEFPDVLENWALAAVPHGLFITEWCRRFDRAVALGLNEHFQELQDLDQVPDGIPGGIGSLPYLTMHAVGALALKDLRARDPAASILVQTRSSIAAGEPLHLHTLHDWDMPAMVKQTLLQREDLEHDFAAIKIRGWEADLLNRDLNAGRYNRNASLVRVLRLSPIGGIRLHGASWLILGMLLLITLVLWVLWDRPPSPRE